MLVIFGKRDQRMTGFEQGLFISFTIDMLAYGKNIQ